MLSYYLSTQNPNKPAEQKLSLQTQSTLADLVFEPLEKLPYNFNAPQKTGGDPFSLKELENGDNLTAMLSVGNRARAREILARCVWQELSRITDQFQSNKERQGTTEELCTHFMAIKKRIEIAAQINKNIEAHFKSIFSIWKTSSPLEEVFKQIIEQYCEQEPKALLEELDKRKQKDEQKAERQNSDFISQAHEASSVNITPHCSLSSNSLSLPNSGSEQLVFSTAGDSSTSLARGLFDSSPNGSLSVGAEESTIQENANEPLNKLLEQERFLRQRRSFSLINASESQDAAIRPDSATPAAEVSKNRSSVSSDSSASLPGLWSRERARSMIVFNQQTITKDRVRSQSVSAPKRN